MTNLAVEIVNLSTQYRGGHGPQFEYSLPRMLGPMLRSKWPDMVYLYTPNLARINEEEWYIHLRPPVNRSLAPQVSEQVRRSPALWYFDVVVQTPDPIEHDTWTLLRAKRAYSITRRADTIVGSEFYHEWAF
jgi:hypothetical protein